MKVPGRVQPDSVFPGFEGDSLVTGKVYWARHRSFAGLLSSSQPRSLAPIFVSMQVLQSAVRLLQATSELLHAAV